MSDYISRNDALNFEISVKLPPEELEPFMSGMSWYGEHIKALPSADVKPAVRGKWLRTDAYPHHLYCSVCYRTYLPTDEMLEMYQIPMSYCPNCGAEMSAEIQQYNFKKSL